MHVYFLRHGLLPIIKIGSSVNVFERALAIRRESGCDMTILAVDPVPAGLRGIDHEFPYHRRFAHLRTAFGEWFNIDDELLAVIADLAGRYPVPVLPPACQPDRSRKPKRPVVPAPSPAAGEAA